MRKKMLLVWLTIFACCGIVYSDTVLPKQHSVLPLVFEKSPWNDHLENQFWAHAAGYGILLSNHEAVLAVPGAKQTPFRIHFVGSHPARIVGLEPLQAKAHYVIGNDTAKWQIGLPTYAKVKYENIYPGIDLIFYGNQDSIEYDFVISPGADPNAIHLSLKGPVETESDNEGNIRILFGTNQICLQKPSVYQQINGIQKSISGEYKMAENQIFFSLGKYDANEPLIIDPVLVRTSYAGGRKDDSASEVAVDHSGNMYITGTTLSDDFVSQNFSQGDQGKGDAFLVKLSPSGTILYSTYFGGSRNDIGRGIDVDSKGNVYISGSTTSNDFPLKHAAQSTKINYQDGFVAKFSPRGHLVYSTYLGGELRDEAESVKADDAGNAYIVGSTRSERFPTVHAIQNRAGSTDVFVTKLDPNGSFIFSTYLGGVNVEKGADIAVDQEGSCYITGWTTSTDFPAVQALQPVLGGDSDGFVAKIDTNSTALVYSTFIGGEKFDNANSIAVDPDKNVYVTGRTSSADFPVRKAVQTEKKRAGDAFITKINASGSRLVYSTYFGDNAENEGTAIAVDPQGGAFVAVRAEAPSANFPVVNPLQGAVDSPQFVVKLSRFGTKLLYSTPFATDTTYIHDIAVDDSGIAYLTGASFFPDSGFQAFVSVIQ